MRPAALFALLTLFASLPAAAAQGSPLAEANALYEESRFSEAAAAYQELLAEHPDEPMLHYNLGNAFFRQQTPGSLGRAVASYLRAFALDPRDADIRHNLKLALGNAGETWVPAGTPPALFDLFHLLSRSEFLGCGLFLRHHYRVFGDVERHIAVVLDVAASSSHQFGHVLGIALHRSGPEAVAFRGIAARPLREQTDER